MGNAIWGKVWQQKLKMQIFYKGLLESWADYYILIYTHHQELMKSVGSHGSLPLQFMVIKVMS
jgi:hypothetical protein